jgi:DNA replication protein DnaC
VLIKKWNLEDWWYRFEWQHRGSVHVHGIGKIKNAPKIEWEQLREDENSLKEITKYIDSLVTTINPGPNTPVPNNHLCQKRLEELHDDEQDYIELVNKLQRHTRCSPAYCLRTKRGQQQSCRFGFPKEESNHTFLRDDSHGHPELITARNDPYINPHSRIQLQGWRANVDLKPILSIHAALQYISKYASKSEPRSEGFSQILNRILNNSNSTDKLLAPVQKLLLHSVAERDISAQETCHLLLGIPLYHSSRTFFSLNLNKETPRWLRGTGVNEDGNSREIENIGWTTRSTLKIYWDRPSEFENFSLYKLYLKYKFTNNKWTKCKTENIIRVWPRPSPLRNGPEWEEFCRVKVLLHVSHRDIQLLTQNNTISWTDLYDHYSEEINADPIDLLGPPIDNNETREITDDESQEEESEDDEGEECRFDWMLLAEMGPNSVIDCSSDLGSRDIDRTYNWISEARQIYSDTDLREADSFIQRVSSRNESNNETEINEISNTDIIDYQILNDKQKTIFKRIESHYHSILTGCQIEPLNIIVMGTAGTGKSLLIRAIRYRLLELTEIKSNSPVLILAPTGVAAFNINGETIHSAFSIPIPIGNNLDITGERLNHLQNRLQNIEYFIIDEKSMVGRKMLALVDLRLRQAFPEQKNQPFGGKSIILFGDFGQLPPVLDHPIYTTNILKDSLSNDSIVAYNQFQEVYKLDIVERQSGNSEEQKEF